MRLVLRPLAAFAAAVVLAGAALADPYVVSNVPVDERADTTTQAQQAAFAAGQVRAARMLVERMTLEEDRAEYGVSSVSAADAQAMIAGLSVADEQRSSQRYIANLTVEFDRGAARDWFRRSGIPFTEAQARPVLVVPVHQDGPDGNEIWDTDWLDAWTGKGFEDWLTPFVTVDEQAEAMITASQALGLDDRAIREVAQAHGAQEVAIIAARQRDGRLTSTGIILDVSEGRTRRTDLPSQSADDWEALALRVMQARQDEWKRETIVRGGQAGSMRLTFLFGGLPEWRDLQRSVTGASLVQNARLDAVSRTGAVMTVSYRGETEQLARELGQRGARLEQDDELGWTVRRR